MIMDDMENAKMMQRDHSSSSSIPEHSVPIHHMYPSLIRSHQFGPPFPGVPTSLPPVSPIPTTLQPRQLTRSMSQPSWLYPAPPISHRTEERNENPWLHPSMVPISYSMMAGDDDLPPRKSHKRSNTDFTFGLSSITSPPLIPLRSSDGSSLVKEEPVVVKEDDVINAYMMNLDNINNVSSYGANKTNSGSDSVGESSASGNLNVAVSSSGTKRRATDEDIGQTSRHQRSVSMDSSFMGMFNDGSESPSLNFPLPPCSVELGNCEFTSSELYKIGNDKKLAETIVTDPKKVKRILANRASAARSKERQTQYIEELEHKVRTLDIEVKTLSAQLTHFERDSMEMSNQNHELKYRLQAMENQAQLRDALSENLTEEVKRLKMMINNPSHMQVGSNSSSESNISKSSLNSGLFQQLSLSQLQENQMNTFQSE